MKTFRDSFEENYMPYEECCSSRKGFRIRYEYIGPWYVYCLEQEQKRRCKSILCILCMLSTCFFMTASLQKCDLNTRSAAVLFSGLSMAAFLFEWFGVLKFLISGEKLTNQTFDEVNRILRLIPALNALLLAGAMLSCIIYMVQNGFQTGFIAVPLFYMLAAVSSGVITVFYRGLPYEKQKNDTWKSSSKNYIRM